MAVLRNCMSNAPAADLHAFVTHWWLGSCGPNGFAPLGPPADPILARGCAAAHIVRGSSVETLIGTLADISLQEQQSYSATTRMRLGMVGLSKMGANMTTRLIQGGHEVVVYDRDPAAVARSAEGGAEGADALGALLAKLGQLGAGPRVVWVMVPAGPPTEDTINTLMGQMTTGDIIIDGGNSNYQDSIRRAQTAAQRGVRFLDAGTSGGVWGLKEGYALMVGGDADAVATARPIFETLAPAPDQGWGHMGPAGSGHFVKMVHNGIEYGLMQAYAEGFSIMRHKHDFGNGASVDLDLAQIAELWRYGSVIRSWLLDLTALALQGNPTMEGIAPYVSDSGEGRWTVAEAIALDVPAPIITGSLIARLRSRDEEGYTERLVSAMRNQFGGHAIKHEIDGGTPA